jgi:SM-20-related protein
VPPSDRRSAPVDIGGVGADAALNVDAALKVDGVAVRDGFLAPALTRALMECAQQRRAHGEFDAARIGSARSLQRREDLRGDSTCWIVPPLLAPENSLLEELERLRLELNREALLGLFDLELHYAWYPPGAAYARHVDQPRGRGQRQVSLVLYLNEGWTRAAGGELRLYDAAGGYRDVEPMAGRLVCFLTPGREHEVLPTLCDRLSISGWFRTREDVA